jgi:hypothetical protein
VSLVAAATALHGRRGARGVAVAIVIFARASYWVHLFLRDVFSAGRLPHRLFPVLIHFSFVTLSSVGYGDVPPVAPLVRSLAALEALTGQLHLVLVVARFVGERAAGPGPADTGASPP